jgi:archaeosortase A (PGF-CTERM-specific)
MYLDASFGLGWATLIVLLFSFIIKKDARKLREVGMILLSFSFILLIPYMLIEDQRIIQSIGLGIAAIGCLYISFGIVTNRFNIQYTTQLITVTLSVFLFIYSIDILQNIIIYTTAKDTVFLLSAAGFEAEILNMDSATYVTFPEATQPLRTRIVTACTGIGTISILIGLISSFDSLTLRQKIGFSFFIASIIYALNAIRNFFIAAAYGYQMLHFAPNLIESIFGKGDEWVSYYIADRIIAQIGSIILISFIGYKLMKKYDSGIIDEWEKIISQFIEDIGYL